MTSEVDICCQWVITEARKKRPQLLLVPQYDLNLVVRHLYWQQQSAEAYDSEDRLREHAQQWLAKRAEIPWWAKLLIRLALTVIVHLLMVWLATYKRRRP